MIQVVKPVVCPVCGRKIINYSINNQTKHFIFTCSKGHTKDLSEEEYIKELRNS